MAENEALADDAAPPPLPPPPKIDAPAATNDADDGRLGVNSGTLDIAAPLALPELIHPGHPPPASVVTMAAGTQGV